jgi:O-succinylbenzoic acid--CoA ligase
MRSDVNRSTDERPRRVLLADRDPRTLQASFLALISKPIDIILIDPATPELEVTRIVDWLKPDQILVTGSPSLGDPTNADNSPVNLAVVPKVGKILIPTGGTTGRPGFAVHTWKTLYAAAAGFCRAFPGPAHTFCILPLWHVGGLMQLIRALITKARFELEDWPSVETGAARPRLEGSFLSLVPTQLRRLLEDPAGAGWLRQFRAIFLGGAAAWPPLLEYAREERIPLAPAYGMTETAAQVCCLRPDEFLCGRSGVGRALPHARLSVVDEKSRPLAACKVGRIRIESESLFLGYSGELSRRGSGYVTSDLGSIDHNGFVTIMGRSDNMINTGGEKVIPAEVEAAIWDVGLVDDVAVYGRSDPEWGETICALFVSDRFPGEIEARRRLKPVLAPQKIPRHWIQVKELPRNALGKLDRRRARDLIEVKDD